MWRANTSVYLLRALINQKVLQTWQFFYSFQDCEFSFKTKNCDEMQRVKKSVNNSVGFVELFLCWCQNVTTDAAAKKKQKHEVTKWKNFPSSLVSTVLIMNVPRTGFFVTLRKLHQADSSTSPHKRLAWLLHETVGELWQSWWSYCLYFQCDRCFTRPSSNRVRATLPSSQWESVHRRWYTLPQF